MMKVSRIPVGPLGTNCYVAHDGVTGFIVDPGDDASRIIEAVKGLNIEYIILTHGHFDHIMALSEVKSETGAKVAIHRAEKGSIESAGESLLGSFMSNVSDFKPVTADILLEGGEEFSCAGETLRIIHTPGHSRGSICIDTGSVLFSGDTLFEDDCGRWDLPGGDYDTLLESLRVLANLPGDRRVCPGHDVTTTLSRERQHNRAIREAMRK
ncbi:MAG: MBL fold metallo-hydrolase [Clostridiales bacterium]|nr:MBL fold metallo-hydrolase [Clostridiales bacterium]